MPIAVHPSGRAAGAEITGCNLATDLDDANFAVIQDALDEHGVIYLRNQTLTPDQQVAFTERFGEPDVNFNALRFGVDGSPTIYRISNITENGEAIGTRRAGETWHTDMSYAKHPALATMLYAVEVPTLHGMPLGGTGFANAAAAYDALPQDLKDAITSLKGVFDFRGRKRSSPVSAEDIAAYPPVEHPIVRTHPRTGRKGLYIVRDDTTGIVGKDADESQALIEALADHVIKPEFIYQHIWQQGDVVVWDNCTVQHRAVQDYGLPQRRLLWRTTVKGGAPY
ncbi:MAG: TauD/TfdA family dioxygenase [Rhodospirillaceae bacterium]|jgi:taurine dioxygenase|nr:TauD/TfdA family dioxygenase [Rhodospirillaceae bacterium]MBT5667092.1 TauD/TfdA family dioxygenase [Rhodospirillaceae bacterium]MBT5811486.1 TauD/TfdA family dioxygenase [Rhodospirillaceae bacterium]